MSVGAVGGGMAMGGAAAMGGVAAAGTGAGTGTAATGSTPGSTSPAGTGDVSTASNRDQTSAADRLADPQVTIRLEQLTELLKDFSSAEILIALMMLKAMEKDDEECGGGGSALGFLAGMAMANQLGQSSQIELNMQVPQVGGQASIGLNINFTG